MKPALLLCAILAPTLIFSPALAQQGHHQNHVQVTDEDSAVHIHSAATTPISIMGDHVHEKGGWMLSYRYMHMSMDGNRNGTKELSPLEISGDFANVTGVGPATLRIVPTEMSMNMHMLGAMYGLTDNLTLVGMLNYIDKDMDHVTFAGGNPDLQIGNFTTRSQGLGDTKFAGLFQLLQNDNHALVAKAAISLPTGSVKERGTILNPMGALQSVRLPYAMQIGSGTYDFEPALTYSAHQGLWGWGAQYNARIHLGENSQNYALGDKHKLSGWAGYQWHENFAATLRLTGETGGKIDGGDPQIAGPVQTANPDFYGGERLLLGFGINFVENSAASETHQFGAELTLPLYQDLNGPQMQRDYGFTLNYRLTF